MKTLTDILINETRPHIIFAEVHKAQNELSARINISTPSDIDKLEFHDQVAAFFIIEFNRALTGIYDFIFVQSAGAAKELTELGRYIEDKTSRNYFCERAATVARDLAAIIIYGPKGTDAQIERRQKNALAYEQVVNPQYFADVA